MRRYVVWLSIAISVFIAASGCSEPEGNIVVGLDEEFVLSVGQSATLTGEDLTIEFVEVVSDSRCPSGATCIWAGEASCLIEITRADSIFSKVLTQLGSSSPNKANFTGYEIAFEVQPYPQLGQEIAATDYRLQLTVSKTPA